MTGELDPAILDRHARIVYVPVRHHSPACARLVRSLIEQVRPAAVLIEGPSDFNDRFHELHLEHELPIAIYTYLRTGDDRRYGAFYPFCEHSPEWQAVEGARAVGARAAFIDLPWAEMVARRDGEDPLPEHRYADGEMRRAPYVEALCREIGVDDFDALWDVLFEIPTGIDPWSLFERLHLFCHHLRASDARVPPGDLAREKAMAAAIETTCRESVGRIVVVTGGFHSHALFRGAPGDAPPSPCDLEAIVERGIALTPYSYERLDSLTGYESGMPNPGFYHRAWLDGTSAASYRSLLASAVRMLRERKQTVSTADLIAVESTARALAALRAHDRVWRRDLIDGLTAAVLKDEIEGVEHPFLRALYDIFRGSARGRLAAGTSLPPLVREISEQLRALDLEPSQKERLVALDLQQSSDRARSRLLHRLRLLGIAGFQRTGGTDFARRDEMVKLFEEWRIAWSPELEATCIEASIYGASAEEASLARLAETARAHDRDATAAAMAFLDAALAGIRRLAPRFLMLLQSAIHADSSFVRVARAVGHLLYLYRFDEALETAHRDDTGRLLAEAFGRAVWLMEVSGRGPSERDAVAALQSVMHAYDLCAGALGLDGAELVEVLRRVAADRLQSAALRGAALGALWSTGETGVDDVLRDLQYSADAEELGDFLAGVFALARETAQRHAEVMRAIDGIVMRYDEQAYLTALPSLRLAFSFFTPREKHALARSLLAATESPGVAPLPDLAVAPVEAAEVMLFEAKVFAALQKYGLRGGEGA